MAQEKQKRKKSKSRCGKGIKWYWALLILLAVFAGTLLWSRPEAQSIRDSIVAQILVKTSISGLLIYFGWFAKSRPACFGRILMTLMALSPWVASITQSGRIGLLYISLLMFAGIGYHIYLFASENKSTTKKRKRRKNDHLPPISFATLYFIVLFFASTMDYAYVEDENQYLLISIILGSILGVGVLIYFLRADKSIWTGKTHMIVCLILVIPVVALVTSGFFLSTARNLNYMLDFSQPEQCTMQIIDKNTYSGGRGPTIYELILLYEGQEVTINVSLSEYQIYEIGDHFQVELYQGFFGDAYYIAE